MRSFILSISSCSQHLASHSSKLASQNENNIFLIDLCDRLRAALDCIVEKEVYEGCPSVRFNQADFARLRRYLTPEQMGILSAIDEDARVLYRGVDSAKEEGYFAFRITKERMKVIDEVYPKCSEGFPWARY